jgi:type IV pilus assembly protein PilY1
MELRRIVRNGHSTLLLAAALLLLAAEQPVAAQPALEPPPLDAYGDDIFLHSTSLAPNVILLMDNSESMSHMEWHPAFDQTVISPTCSVFTDGADYVANDLAATYGFPNAPSFTITECGNTRTLWDPSRSDAKSVEALWWGRYLNWYFSDAADPYVNEIETAMTTGPGCKGVEFPDVYRRTRFQASKQVLLDVLCVAEEKNVRFGLAHYRTAQDAAGLDPNGGYIAADLGRSNPNHASELESGIKNAFANDISPDGNDETPLAESLFQIYTYWMSRDAADMPSSDQDGDTVPSTFPVYQYDKFGNYEASSTKWFEDAMLYPCEKAFVVIVTDGQPTRDDFDEELVANTALGFTSFDDLIGDYHVDGPSEDAEEVPAAFALLDERAFYLDDIAQYMYENDFRPDMAGDQTIDTYTVGFAADAATQAFLDRTALLGNGLSFTAKDGEELAEKLVAALNDIIEKSASFTAASVPSARTSDGGDFYQSYFFPRSASAFWEGHVRAWHMTADGDIHDANDVCALDDPGPTPDECNSGPFKADAVYFWDAAEQVPQPDETITPGRNLYVSRSASRVDWTQTNIDAADLLIDGFTNPGMVPSDPTPNDLAYPLAGSRALTEEGLADEVVAFVRGCFFGTGVAANVDLPVSCLARSATLGDVFHSSPVVVRSPNRVVFGEPSYDSFKTHYATPNPRDRVLYAGTNGGFLEAIHAGDWDAGATPPGYDEGTGTELFGFMPWEARIKIKNLPIDSATSRTHYVDGDPQSADVWFYTNGPTIDAKEADGNEWRTILVGAQREGGHHYYALDITNPNGSSAAGGGAPLPYPGYLWEFPTEADAAAGGGYFEWMGETWGKPIITKVRLNVNATGPYERWVVIVTAGYDPNADPNPTDVTGLVTATYNASTDLVADPDAKRGRAIFMLDAMTGDVIAMKRFNPTSVVVGDPEKEMKYALVAKPSVLDLNADGFADIIYFADMGGQVFKWVISDPGEDRANDINGDPTDQPHWPLKIFFQAPVGNISGTDFFKNFFFSPAAAYSGGRLWLAFGSGERRSLSFAGIGGDPDSEPAENNRYYVMSDSDPYERMMVPTPTLTEGDLTPLTGIEDGSAAVGSYGFYFRVGNGDKFVTNSEIFAGHVIAASFKPTDTGDPCTARGDGTLYIFDLLTGEGYFDDASSNPTRGLDIGGGLPTDPKISVGAGGKNNQVIVQKSDTAIGMFEEPDISVGGGLLYWRERF